MSRMIPGRIRNQGIELYDQGLVQLVSKEDGVLEVTVQEHRLTYALEDERVTCDCDFFARKNYCEHLAALEYYLKNDKEGKQLSEQLQSNKESHQETQ